MPWMQFQKKAQDQLFNTAAPLYLSVGIWTQQEKNEREGRHCHRQQKLTEIKLTLLSDSTSSPAMRKQKPCSDTHLWCECTATWNEAPSDLAQHRKYRSPWERMQGTEPSLTVTLSLSATAELNKPAVLQPLLLGEQSPEVAGNFWSPKVHSLTLHVKTQVEDKTEGGQKEVFFLPFLPGTQCMTFGTLWHLV